MSREKKQRERLARKKEYRAAGGARILRTTTLSTSAQQYPQNIEVKEGIMTDQKTNIHVLPPSDNPLFAAIVMMYEIARSRGIDPGIDEDLVRRLHKAAYKTEGNVAVPVSIREGGNATCMNALWRVSPS